MLASDTVIKSDAVVDMANVVVNASCLSAVRDDVPRRTAHFALFKAWRGIPF